MCKTSQEEEETRHLSYKYQQDSGRVQKDDMDKASLSLHPKETFRQTVALRFEIIAKEKKKTKIGMKYQIPLNILFFTYVSFDRYQKERN